MVPHLGTESAASSPRSLRYSSRRAHSGSFALGPSAVCVFLPVRVLSRVFRGKFIAGLKRMFRTGKVVMTGRLSPLASRKAFDSFLRILFRNDLVVYAKPPFGGPDHVLHYLARSHPPRRHFQPPPDWLRRRSGHLSMEGLRTWKQETEDDRFSQRVPSALPAAHSTA